MNPVQNSPPLAVAFAPDWSQDNPYQANLQAALQRENVVVSFAQPRMWDFPLAEASMKPGTQLLHLHFPGAFFNPTGRLWRILTRKLIYWIDFQRALSHCPLVLTAHNLYPHNRRDEFLVSPLIRMTHARARAIIAHSAAAAETIQNEFGIASEKMHVIPHGTTDEEPPALFRLSPAEARARLGLNTEKPVCLMFGMMDPYKGIEEVIRFWKAQSPDCDLCLVGSPNSPGYGLTLAALVDHHPHIHFEPKRLTDDELTLWLRAANCVLFNYVHILTSGAAVQARSLGIPVLLPHRLRTIDLREPHPLVTRFAGFENDFAPALKSALATQPDYSLAADFREATSWTRVGQATARVYRSILEN